MEAVPTGIMEKHPFLHFTKGWGGGGSRGKYSFFSDIDLIKWLTGEKKGLQGKIWYSTNFGSSSTDLYYLLNMFILFAVECKCLKKMKAAVENLIHVGLILEFWLRLCQDFLIRVITKVLLTDNSRIPENIHILELPWKGQNSENSELIWLGGWTWRERGDRVTSLTNLTNFSHCARHHTSLPWDPPLLSKQ